MYMIIHSAVMACRGGRLITIKCLGPVSSEQVLISS